MLLSFFFLLLVHSVFCQAPFEKPPFHGGMNKQVLHPVRGYRTASDCTSPFNYSTLFIEYSQQLVEDYSDGARTPVKVSCAPCKTGTRFSYAPLTQGQDLNQLNRRQIVNYAIGGFRCKNNKNLCVETTDGRYFVANSRSTVIWPVPYLKEGKPRVLMVLDYTESVREYNGERVIQGKDMIQNGSRSTYLNGTDFPYLDIKGIACNSCEQTLKYCHFVRQTKPLKKHDTDIRLKDSPIEMQAPGIEPEVAQDSAIQYGGYSYSGFESESIPRDNSIQADNSGTEEPYSMLGYGENSVYVQPDGIDPYSDVSDSSSSDSQSGDSDSDSHEHLKPSPPPVKKPAATYQRMPVVSSNIRRAPVRTTVAPFPNIQRMNVPPHSLPAARRPEPTGEIPLITPNDFSQRFQQNRIRPLEEPTGFQLGRDFMELNQGLSLNDGLQKNSIDEGFNQEPPFPEFFQQMKPIFLRKEELDQLMAQRTPISPIPPGPVIPRRLHTTARPPMMRTTVPTIQRRPQLLMNRAPMQHIDARPPLPPAIMRPSQHQTPLRAPIQMIQTTTGIPMRMTERRRIFTTRRTTTPPTTTEEFEFRVLQPEPLIASEDLTKEMEQQQIFEDQMKAQRVQFEKDVFPPILFAPPTTEPPTAETMPLTLPILQPVEEITPPPTINTPPPTIRVISQRRRTLEPIIPSEIPTLITEPATDSTNPTTPATVAPTAPPTLPPRTTEENMPSTTTTEPLPTTTETTTTEAPITTTMPPLPHTTTVIAGPVPPPVPVAVHRGLSHGSGAPPGEVPTMQWLLEHPARMRALLLKMKARKVVA